MEPNLYHTWDLKTTSSCIPVLLHFGPESFLQFAMYKSKIVRHSAIVWLCDGFEIIELNVNHSFISDCHVPSSTAQSKLHDANNKRHSWTYFKKVLFEKKKIYQYVKKQQPDNLHMYHKLCRSFFFNFWYIRTCFCKRFWSCLISSKDNFNQRWWYLVFIHSFYLNSFYQLRRITEIRCLVMPQWLSKSPYLAFKYSK